MECAYYSLIVTFIFGNSLYGVVEEFIWITKEEIYYIMRKHLKDNISSLHISLLTLQPMSRNLNYNPKYEMCRNQVQVKWYNLADNIIEIMAFHRKPYSNSRKSNDIITMVLV